MKRFLMIATVAMLASCAPVDAPPIDLSVRTLEEAIEQSAAHHRVPKDLLLALSWNESHWGPSNPADNEAEQQAIAAGQSSVHGNVEIGPFHLRHGAGLGTTSDTLALATRKLGIDEAALRNNLALQVDGAAAVLAELGARTGARPDDLDSWAPAVAQFSGLDTRAAQTSYVRAVWDTLRDGLSAESFTGERLVVHSRPVRTIAELLHIDEAAQSAAMSLDYPSALWVPAASDNYTAGRSGQAITMVVIHTMQGSYGGSISWFQNSDSNASAHYMIRSSDGQITQMVRESNTAWHGGNSFTNRGSIGIEHEGFVMDPQRWYTEAMYVSSARLTRALCDKYRIPIDRQHIIGHYQIPTSGSGAPCSPTATNCGGAGNHTDPGNGGTQWNWTHFMDLVRGNGTTAPPYAATLGTIDYPRDMVAGDRAVAYVEYRNTGSATWDNVNTRLGTTNPRDHAGRFYDSVNWISRTRATSVDRATAPNTIGRFSFMITAPAVTTATTITESFGLVQEGRGWFGPADTAVTFSVRVSPRAVVVTDAGTPMDAGSALDAAVPTDASVANDATVVGDAGAPRDVAVPTDSGAARDAGARADTGAARDVSGGADGSTTGNRPEGGCGCRTAPNTSPRTSLASLAVALGALTSVSRRRRRRS